MNLTNQLKRKGAQKKMKIEMKFKALAINKTETVGVKDATKTYYGVVLATDLDGGSMSCTKDVFDKIVRMKDFEFTAVFDDKYGSMRIIDCVLAVK